MPFPCICETRLTWVQREGWRVYSSDMGYVPWKVCHLFHYPPHLRPVFKIGLCGGLLESGWRTLCKYLIYIVFKWSWLACSPIYILLYTWHRTSQRITVSRQSHPLRHTPDCLLRVCTSSLLANVDAYECNVARTLAWRKRVISRCRLKGSTNSAKHSPSSPGIRYRTLHSSKQNKGKTYSLAEDVYRWPLEGIIYLQVVGGHTRANSITLQIGSWALHGVPALVLPPLSHISTPCFFITILIQRSSRDFEKFVSSLNVAGIYLTIFPDTRGSMARAGTAIARLSSINCWAPDIYQITIHRIDEECSGLGFVQPDNFLVLKQW